MAIFMENEKVSKYKNKNPSQFQKNWIVTFSNIKYLFTRQCRDKLTCSSSEINPT